MSASAGARWPGERVLIDACPSLWFIVVGRPWWIVLAGTAALCSRVSGAGAWSAWIGGASWWVWWAALAVLIWAILDFACRRYTLTDRRIVRASGVLRRVIIEAPLENVQSVTLLRSIRERMVGIGTLGVSTAGSAGFELTWFMVSRPDERLAEVRRAVARVPSAPSGVDADDGEPRQE